MNSSLRLEIRTKDVRSYLEKAKSEHFALGAFNAGNLETIKAIVQAAVKMKAPVIIESSPGETTFFGSKRLVDVIRDFREELDHPIYLNLDHSLTQEASEMAIKDGYDLVHFDGGKLPWEENIAIVQKLAQEAHQRGLIIEGETEKIVGSSSAHPGENIEAVQALGSLSDPEKVKEFVQKTKVDTFAVSVGNVHGFYSQPKRLDIALLGRIAKVNPDTFLAMHGGSGIADEDIKQALQLNIVKININSELRIAYRRALESSLEQNPNSFAIYEYMGVVIEAVQKIVEEKISLFGSEDKI